MCHGATFIATKRASPLTPSSFSCYIYSVVYWLRGKWSNEQSNLKQKKLLSSYLMDRVVSIFLYHFWFKKKKRKKNKHISQNVDCCCNRFPWHLIACVAPIHDLLAPPSTIFFILPGDDRLGPVSDLEAVGREGGSESRTASITLYFSPQSSAARRLTHSLWDILDNSQCGKCVVQMKPEVPFVLLSVVIISTSR